MAHHAARSLGSELWSARPTPCTSSNCQDFARAAKSLEGLQGALHRLVGRFSGDVWAAYAGDGRFGRRVAFEIGKRLSLPTDQAMTATAMFLRVLGILCCVSAGRGMTECDCLYDWAKGYAVDELESRLEELAKQEVWPLAA